MGSNEVIYLVYGEGKIYCTWPTGAAKAGQKSLVRHNEPNNPTKVEPLSCVRFCTLLESSPHLPQFQQSAMATPLYSRGYKNHAIVKKLFRALPIFYSGLECQLFVFIMFFDTRKGLNCLMWTFFCQSASAGSRRRPWHHTFFFSLKTFTRYLVEILLYVLTNFQRLINLGLWPGKRMVYLWQQVWTAGPATAPQWRTSLLRKEASQMTRERLLWQLGNNKKLSFESPEVMQE